ncbi:MAG: hypothetical protein IPJ82_03265 [Lewinellaceae bacterium]|nr:hypothetical protein [Lewinellaceae bacterium]
MITQTLGNTCTVTVTDAAGCIATDLFHLKTFVMEEISITMGSSSPLCLGDSLLLFTSIWQNVPPGTTYLWSTGETSADIYVYGSGTYSVTATAASINCTVTASINVVFNPVPDPAPVIVGPATLCSGQSATLTVSGGPFASYIWIPPGSSGSTLDITEPGNYILGVTNSFRLLPALTTSISCPGARSQYSMALPPFVPGKTAPWK